MIDANKDANDGPEMAASVLRVKSEHPEVHWEDRLKRIAALPQVPRGVPMDELEAWLDRWLQAYSGSISHVEASKAILILRQDARLTFGRAKKG